MRQYTYTKNNTVKDDYGQYLPNLEGTVLMWICNKSNTPVTSNPVYNEAEYVGITTSKEIDESCIINLNETTKLKVLYIIPDKFTQVIMKVQK